MRHDGTTSPDARFIAKTSGTNLNDNYWKIGPRDGRTLRARLKVGGTTREILSSAGVFEFGQWHHIVMVYDGTEFFIQIDGQKVVSTVATGPLSTDPAVAVALGNQPAGTGERAFEGALDQVRLYQRALGEDEINALRVSPPE